MGETILNFFEKTDNLFFKKVPYQVYMVGAFVSLLIVAGSVYEYTHPDPNVQNLIGLKQMQDELFNNYSDVNYPYENQIGWSNPLGANGEQIFDEVTGKPLEDNY